MRVTKIIVNILTDLEPSIEGVTSFDIQFDTQVTNKVSDIDLSIYFTKWVQGMVSKGLSSPPHKLLSPPHKVLSPSKNF